MKTVEVKNKRSKTRSKAAYRRESEPTRWRLGDGVVGRLLFCWEEDQELPVGEEKGSSSETKDQDQGQNNEQNQKDETQKSMTCGRCKTCYTLRVVNVLGVEKGLFMINPLENPEITRRELGQGLAEYALLVGGVSVVAASALGPVANAIGGVFGSVADAVGGGLTLSR